MNYNIYECIICIYIHMYVYIIYIHICINVCTYIYGHLYICIYMGLQIDVPGHVDLIFGTYMFTYIST